MEDSIGRVLLEALNRRQRVSGLTHDFYNYPARFDPGFVRTVIELWSEPGDCVLDPFMGGGTTIVEAMARGRVAAGIDINPLATLIVDAKTLPLEESDVRAVEEWSLACGSHSHYSRDDWRVDARMNNVPEHLGTVLHAVRCDIEALKNEAQRRFARCAALQVGQWAFEARGGACTVEDIYNRFRVVVPRMLRGLQEFVAVAEAYGVSQLDLPSHRFLFEGRVQEVCSQVEARVPSIRPRLVLASPPYPGVHVLYHRWQLRGRRETPAPFWLANMEDGKGPAHYTMGGRSALGLSSYFMQLEASFAAIRQIMDPQSAGFCELTFPTGTGHTRLSRIVPNRKWYTRGSPTSSTSQEVLLIHAPIA